MYFWKNYQWYLKLFPINLKSPWFFKRKVILKTNKSDSDFQLWTPTPRTPLKKNNGFWKFLGVNPPRKSGRGRGSGVLIFDTNKFSQNSWSCQQAYRCAGHCQKLPLDGAKNFLSGIWQHITSQFCVSFHFCCAQETKKMPLNMSKLGLNII